MMYIIKLFILLSHIFINKLFYSEKTLAYFYPFTYNKKYIQQLIFQFPSLQNDIIIFQKVIVHIEKIFAIKRKKPIKRTFTLRSLFEAAHVQLKAFVRTFCRPTPKFGSEKVRRSAKSY